MTYWDILARQRSREQLARVLTPLARRPMADDANHGLVRLGRLRDERRAEVAVTRGHVAAIHRRLYQQ